MAHNWILQKLECIYLIQEPEKPAKWDGVKDATSHGSVCPQVSSFTGTTEAFQNEDCLYLNIYSPFQVGERFVTAENTSIYTKSRRTS